MKENIDKTKKKILIAKKNREEYYLREVKEYFEDKNKYLQLSNNITIGNLYMKNKKYNKNTNANSIKYNSENETYIYKKPYNTIESKNTRNKDSIKSISRPKTASETITIKSRNNNKFWNTNKKHLKKYYEIKSPKEIINLYNLYKNNINNNKKNKDFISENLSDFIKKKYYIQEKTLNNRQKNILNNKTISKFLSYKCNKNKNNLLLNSNNKFLHKNQLLNYLYKNKKISDKLGDYYWLINLRRSSNDKKEYKTNYVNIGDAKNEFWEHYFDPGNDDIELVVNPNGFENDSIEKNEKYEIIKSFKDLRVDGKNLLNKEINKFMDEIENEKNNVRIKLYKDPSELKNKNIRNIIFKENYLRYQKFKRNEKPLKKSFSLSYKHYSNNNQTKNSNNLIYL